jgi:uncharacterized protein
MLLSGAYEVCDVWIRFADFVRPKELRESLPATTVPLGYEYDLALEPVELVMTVTPVEESHRLEGSFDYRGSVPCCRCLEPVAVSGTARFDLLYRPSVEGEIPPEVESGTDAPDEDVVYYEEETLDLGAFVAQQMYLEVPDKILCRENCRGLCLTCGANLNQKPCGCPQATDPRWEALSSFVNPQ